MDVYKEYELRKIARAIMLAVLENLDFQRNGTVELPKGLTVAALQNADLDHDDLEYIGIYIQSFCGVIKNSGPVGE